MSEIIEKVIEAKQTPREFDLSNSCDNLYHICLQYYSSLKKLNHPKISLITDVMDCLIELKKSMKEGIKDDHMKTYDSIHGMAYKNIQDVYDYDKENKVLLEEASTV